MKKIGLIIMMQIGMLVSYSQINYVDQSSSVLINDNTGFSFEGSGVSFVDYNDDGFDDITLATGEDDPMIFYRNVDGVFFTREYLISSVDYSYRMRSVVWVDYDNDGDKDLFLGSDLEGNRLFNNNNGTLTDVTQASGLPLDNLFTYGVSFGDYNNDGCLDLYLSNRVVLLPITNYLFENNCDGTFTDVTQAAGLGNTNFATYSTAFFDFNNDGWQDLYEANDKGDPNILFKNNGDGTFTDVSVSSNAGIIIDAMCVTIDDYDSDGYLDIFITNRPGTPDSYSLGTVLLRNNGNETFTDVTDTANVSLLSFTWGSNFIDSENDGDLDLYVNSQYTLAEGPSYGFYENNNGSFTSSLTSGFTTNNYRSFSSAIGDYNNDGVMEIMSNNNENQIPSLWVNSAVVNNNYLAIDLEGVTSNKDGIGSKIEISINGTKQYRYINCGEGYLSQNSTKEIFGVGTSTSVDYVQVEWLSGTIDRINNVSVNQVLKVVEGSGALSVDDNNLKNLNIYPNPAENILNIDAQQNVTQVNVYNMIGQKLIQFAPNSLNVEMDVTSLSSGAYFIKVISADASKTVRIIKK